jgi:uncharacterized protein
MAADRPKIPGELVDDFCRRNHISKLSVFGSYLRDDFGPESDIDFLVEFVPECIPTLLGIVRMERELSEILGGCRVDLRTPEDLSRYFRAQVMSEAEVRYAE